MLKYFLRIEVTHSKQGILISQQKYVIGFLKEIGKLACKPTSTPIDPNHKFGEAKEDVAVYRKMYQCLTRGLIYLSHTRLHIAYIVSVINQFMQSPKEVHLQVAKLLTKCYSTLKGLQEMVFYLNEAWDQYLKHIHANYARSMVDRSSTTKYCTFLGGNPMTWRSKKIEFGGEVQCKSLIQHDGSRNV